MDELSRLVMNARALVLEGYYDVPDPAARPARAPSFLETLGRTSQPSDVIAEIKFASPTMRSGKAPDGFGRLLDAIVEARPLGLSVLAEPRIFQGHLEYVRAAATRGVPVLFKDVVVDFAQVDAAAATGASAVLVIQALFAHGLLDGHPQQFIDRAHDADLDAILEVHTPEEWDAALGTDADVIGINNRDLVSMAVDLRTTERILAAKPKDRPVIAMSGIETRAHVAAMRRAGADAVLVGSSIMASDDPARVLRELQHD
jgi:indole-3-glycerol phosphate synthase